MACGNKLENKGFALLELLLALGIIGIIAAFAISISYSSRSIVKTNETKKKMQKIARTVEEFYRGHGDLPAPAGTGSNEIPVGTSELSLEQTFRLDGWGRYFYYDRALDSNLASRTDIGGLTVNGKDVAGVIVSGGPDQTIDPGNLSSPYATTGDDIVMGINVSGHAMQIALNDLQVLQNKVQAFDAVFAGVDNNSTGGVDEDGCISAAGCPSSGITNDPNCGSATLDNISSFICGYVITSSTAFIVDFYALNSAILLDPWLNEYVWGTISGNIRYHKFFSAGPDGNPGNGDDVIL